MIKGKKVKIRFKRSFDRQPLWVFVGNVTEFTEQWVTIEGKGICLFIGSAIPLKTAPIDIDSESRTLLIPRESIAHIRILPDDFDFDNMEIERKGLRNFLKVKNGPDASLGEIGETV